MVKECTKCGIEKPLTEYHKNSQAKFGADSQCKPCANKCRRERYRKPEVRERKSEYRREYLQRPEVREYRHEYRQRPEVRERNNEDYRLRKELGLVSNRHVEITQKYATRSGSWSDAEVKFLMSSELSLVNIALELGRTYQSVHSKRREMRKKLKSRQ